MKRPPIIIDTDPGIDDALALILAKRDSSFGRVAITTVAGNVSLQHTTQNAQRLVAFLGANDWSIHEGAENPLGRDLNDAADTHGEDGLGNPGLEEEFALSTPADEFLDQQLEGSEGPIDILALGPLTNIALLARRKPDTFRKKVRLWIMGGAFKSHGNISPVAEFNFWVDPEAAREVLETGVPIHLLPLDVTRELVLTPNMRELIRQIDSPDSRLIHKMTRFYNDFHWKHEGLLGSVINDPIVMATYRYPEMVEWIDVYAEVLTDGPTRGQLLVDWADTWKKQKNIRLAITVDTEAFFRYFFSTLFPNFQKHWEQFFKPPMPLGVKRPLPLP